MGIADIFRLLIGQEEEEDRLTYLDFLTVFLMIEILVAETTN